MSDDIRETLEQLVNAIELVHMNELAQAKLVLANIPPENSLNLDFMNMD